MTPLLMFAICWMAFHTDARVRMGRGWAAALVASAAIILTCVLGGSGGAVLAGELNRII